MNKKLFVFASISMMLAIILGAFGAHALKQLIEPQQLSSFNTGIRYQLIHSLAIFIIGVLPFNINIKTRNIIGGLFSVGILFFSTSIYLLSLQNLIGTSLKWLGPITPLGGLCFIIGWGCLSFNIIKSEFLPKNSIS